VDRKTTLAFRDECWVFGSPVKRLLLACALYPLFGLLGPALVAQVSLLERPDPGSSTLAGTLSPSAQTYPLDVLPGPDAANPAPADPQQRPPMEQPSLGPPAILIPRLSRGPSVDDFITMKPLGEVAQQMVKVTGFVQRVPHDGAAVSQRTEAYLGYDQKNLYVVFVCFDDPGKVRARKSRREDVTDDDTVEIMLDTFHDRRRAYAFQINPLGVQWDAIWSETPHEEVGGNFDTSWDTVWY